MTTSILEVAPIEGVQLSVRVGVFHPEGLLSSSFPADAVRHFGLAILEPERQLNSGAVFFAVDGVPDGLNRRFSQPWNENVSDPLVAVDLDFHRRDNRIGPVRADRRENLADRTAEFAAPDLTQGFPLLGRRVLVEDELERAVSLVHGAGKPRDRRESNAVERDCPEMTFSHLQSDQSLALIVGRPSVELAWAAPGAVAACDLLAGEPPNRLSICTRHRAGL